MIEIQLCESAALIAECKKLREENTNLAAEIKYLEKAEKEIDHYANP